MFRVLKVAKPIFDNKVIKKKRSRLPTVCAGVLMLGVEWRFFCEAMLYDIIRDGVAYWLSVGR